MASPPRGLELTLLRTAQSLWEIDDLQDFRVSVLAHLRALVGCNLASYNEICVADGQAFVVADPSETLESSATREQLESFGELVMENPLAAHYARTADSRTVRLSDFISLHGLRELELYDLVYRHLETERQLAFTVPSQNQLIGVTVSRSASEPDFDEREIALLDAVRAIVVPLHRSLSDRARLDAVLRALDGEERGPQAVVLVHASGLLTPAHARAERLLRSLAREPGELDALAAWVRAQRRARVNGGTPLRLRTRARELEARYLHGPLGTLDTVTVRALAGTGAPALRALGLTERQAEVLELVRRGRSNAEIAGCLSISEHTVRHHLEHIYRLLGVSSRSAAAHVASGAVLDDSIAL